MDFLKRLNFFVALFLFVAASAASAQTLLEPKNAPIQSTTSTYYSLGGQGGLMITVNLWGFVGKPGQYEVPGSTNLIQLISLAGGPTPDAELDKVEIVRQTMQPDSSYKTDVIPIDLRDFKTEGKQMPLLSPGDTIIVPGSTSESLRLVLALLGPVFSLVTAVGTLILILRR
jgi:SLBB domain